ncbi:serine protease [Prolixibacteraceae bacterium Z1-6]|uniref:Serine protease n=1 Tax=Draconibacterium aestuarii TaxID=2998507 RepID=A0A9X3F780_9BACT|nr:serine protease [Prolixibacteraceae bacterium Z1-6]
MKKLFLLVFSLYISSLSLSAQSSDIAISSKALNSTIMLRVKSGTNRYNVCTGFFFNHNNESYIVTAKHLFDSNIPNGETQLFDFFYNDSWHSDQLKVYFHPNKYVDVAVIKINHYMQTGIIVSQGVILSQKLFILGFPNNLRINAPKLSKKPFPVVKQGVLSAIISDEKFSDVILTDIVNNKGFSGGPALMFDYKDKEWKVIGLVSGKMKNPNPEQIDFLEQGFTIIQPTSYFIEIIDAIE